MQAQYATNLLWTGGWDSTFRLLELLLIQRRPVQPYYLMIADRPSSQREVDAMGAIRNEVAKTDPNSAARISQLEVVRIEDVPEIPCVTERFQRLLSRRHLGSQYEYVGAYGG